MLNFVLGVKKQLKEVQAAILWLVFVERAFVIYVRDLGSQIIRTILNVIYLKKVRMIK
jgi:hypothetical protein